MARSSPFQGDFSAGEISPLAYGKVQEERYKRGLARSLNGIPRLEGGWTRRSGTRIVWPIQTNNTSKLKEFKFSGTSAVMLQFTPGFIFFYTRTGPVMLSGSPYFVAAPWAQSEISTLSFQQFKDTLYIASSGHPPMKLVFSALTSWLLTGINFKDGPYASLYWRTVGVNGPLIYAQDAASYTGGSSFPLGTTVLRIADSTPTSISSLGGQAVFNHGGELAYMKEGDSIWVRGTSVAAANGDWIITNVGKNSFSLVGSVYSGATVNSPGGSGTDTSFVKKNILYGPIPYSISNFRFSLSNASLSFYGPVTQLGSVGGRVYDFCVSVSLTGISTQVQCTSYRPPAYGVDFSGQAFYPTCVAFHENRLFLGSNIQQVIYGSTVGVYENFAPSDFATNSTTDNSVISAASAVGVAFLSGQRDAINWMVSDEKGLVVGTSGGPWIVRPSSINDGLTPFNITAKKLTGYPTNTMAPAVVGKSVIHLDPTARTVREVAYFYSVDGFRSVDLSEYYSHLSSKGITTEIVYQNVPASCMWLGRSDGTFLGITYDRAQDDLRMGWHQHQLGGQSDVAGSLPIIESMAVMPAPDGSTDDVWMIVKRYIGGTVYRTIEYMSKIFESFNRIESANFLDCSIEIDNPIDVKNATNGVTTSFQATAHGLVTGDKIRLRDIVGLAAIKGAYSPLNDVRFTVTVTNANNFTVNYDSSALTPFIVTDAVALGLPGRAQLRKMNTVISSGQLALFNGETLDVLGDGAYLGSFVVAAGAINLTIPAGQVQIGYGFSSEFKQLRLEAGASDGTSIGKLRRINEVQIMVDRSASFEFGSNFDSMYATVFRQTADNVNLEAPLFSGISVEGTIDFQYDTENQVCIRQKDPLPLTVLAILPQQVTYDKG